MNVKSLTPKPVTRTDTSPASEAAKGCPVSWVCDACGPISPMVTVSRPENRRGKDGNEKGHVNTWRENSRAETITVGQRLQRRLQRRQQQQGDGRFHAQTPPAASSLPEEGKTRSSRNVDAGLGGSRDATGSLIAHRRPRHFSIHDCLDFLASSLWSLAPHPDLERSQPFLDSGTWITTSNTP